MHSRKKNKAAVEAVATQKPCWLDLNGAGWAVEEVNSMIEEDPKAPQPFAVLAFGPEISLTISIILYLQKPIIFFDKVLPVYF